ncbi:MAG: TlpA family protein disulfide reductase [Candidatus Rokubacteria bacterium]|nr:TlpA family protein disulfide reductase [Candidatus Rokubacteria bacterium]MBI2014208.1 TlpA family protein disulfide reductase [Candidatus Rokubacteria bacterium]MBI2490604.1 TlpA family protein disulfide reductase [Candidatus Rokubacteria bacterium]MBI4254979.1 TlpA family protein disulfide reductase [Candidatus Rokubacteria bacterium]MBI4628479.1 TlpA family protein disulfide reductase [Candidatus Rokubacteria bacterium]
MPPVQKLHAAYKARGFEVLLVSFREDPALVRRTVRERGYTAPVLLDESGDTTGRGWGVWAPPTMYFVDRQGRLVGRMIGPGRWESREARAFVEALLARG